MPLSKKIPKSVVKKNSCAGRVYVNRYRVVKRLGSGSFGTVFLVEDLRADDEKKVLKEIFVGELKADETFDAKHEADLLAKLNHPNIVKFYDSFLENESFCIVTEFCEGGDLTDKINVWKKSGKKFEESLIVAWFIQLLMAIQFVHKMKVLHRDLKTRNIFLKNNMIKIGDFGISRILMSTSDMASTFTGTPYYMSPEILQNQGYNSKSDIWALGAVLYELCTLDRAFDGQNLLGVMHSILEAKSPELPDNYHPQLKNVLKSMLNRQPDERPSAAELLKNPYISKNLEEMKSKMDLHNSKKHDHSGHSKQRNQTSEYKNTDYKTPQQRPMTPLQKMQWRKQQKANAEAEKLKKYTVENFAENRKQYSNVKKKQSKVHLSALLPWVAEHPDVFSNIAADSGETMALQSYDEEALQVRSSGDSGHVGSADENDDETYSENLDDDLTLTNVSEIPEDSLAAETYYSQFENEFEDIEDSEGSQSDENDDDGEHDALVYQMQAALELGTQNTLTEDETIEEQFSQSMRQQRIKGLRQECIKILGAKSFNEVYNFLKEARFGAKSQAMDEATITERLKTLVNRPTDCFLVDQLIFLEKQVEISSNSF